jgi:hypothetical protein
MDATVMREMTDAEVFGSPVRVPQTGAPRVPRGIRNNNPGNIEDGPFARSQPGYKGSDGRFAIYETPEAGTAAKTALLGSYGRKGINTVEGVVNRWAPPSENDSGSYAQFVSQKLGVDPRAPLDMNDPRVLSELSSAIAQRENGVAAPSSMPGVEMSESEVFGKPKPPPLPGQPGAIPIPQMGPGVTMERVAPPTDRGMKAEGLGLLKGVTAPVFNASGHLERAVTGTPMGNAMAQQGAGLRKMLPQGLTSFIDSPEAFFAEQARKGTLPGKVGEFAGNVLGTAFVPGGPVTSSALSGALLSEKETPLGVLGDATLAGVTGSIVGKGLEAAKAAGTKAFANVPQIMNIAALKKGYQDAYKAIDNSGFSFTKDTAEKLIKDFEAAKTGRALSKSAADDADNIIAYANREIADGRLRTVSQIEKLRTDIYDAMVKKGGDAGALGGAFRSKIDQLFDTAPNPDLKRARDLYKRWTTADFVNRASKSADRAAEQTYGGDFGRKVKDRLAPLVDELKPTRNIRGASDDVKAAIEKVVRGSKTQNLASTLGGMTDVRRLGGKLLQGTLGAGGAAGAIGTGGASIIPSLVLQSAIAGGGAGLTATASGIARKNVDDLIKLIAVGGSKQDLTRAQLAAAIQQLGRKTAAGLQVSVAPALAAFQRPEASRKDEKSPNSRTRP